MQRVVVTGGAGILHDLRALQILDETFGIRIANFEFTCFECHVRLLLLLIHGTFGTYTDAARRYHEFPVLISVLRDRFREHEFTGSFSFFFPGFTGFRRCGEDIADLDLTVVFVMLFGVQSAAATTAATATRSAFDTRRLLARAEPRLSCFRPEKIVWIELCARLYERRRCDDRSGFSLLRVIRIVVQLIVVADRTRKHHDVARFDRESFDRHGSPRFLNLAVQYPSANQVYQRKIRTLSAPENRVCVCRGTR